MAKGLKYYMVYFYPTSWCDTKETVVFIAHSRAAVKRLMNEAYPQAVNRDIRLMEEKV